MGSEGTNKHESEENKKTKLIPSQFQGRQYVGVQLPWRGGIDIVARQVNFYDRALALADLPEPGEWSKILELSQRYGIPSIWLRARPSRLENDAAALLTALAFSNRKQQIRLIQKFLEVHHLKAGLRGRPRVDPRETKDITRGIQIERLEVRLREGFELKVDAKRAGSLVGIQARLRNLGYEDDEVAAILNSGTLQRAACCLYYERTRSQESVDLKAILNSYAKYKRRRAAGVLQPASHGQAKPHSQ